MKIYIKYFLTFLFLLCSVEKGNSQLIISLLLGDNLNTGKIEFGLDGGANFYTLAGADNTSYASGFHLGFYFDIKLKNPAWKVHTGVIVKSTMGTDGLKPYSTGDLTLDSLFAPGEVERRIGYFNVPVMMKYSFKNRIYVEGGIQLALINSASDKFVVEGDDKQELNYTIKNRSSYHPLDAGLIGGIGWRIMKGYGMNLGVRYYAGLVDVTIDDSGDDVFNRSIYLALGIPIGVGKAMKRAEEKKKLEQQ